MNEKQLDTKFRWAAILFTINSFFAVILLIVSLTLLNKSVTCYQSIAYDNNERIAKVVKCNE